MFVRMCRMRGRVLLFRAHALHSCACVVFVGVRCIRAHGLYLRAFVVCVNVLFCEKVLHLRFH